MKQARQSFFVGLCALVALAGLALLLIRFGELERLLMPSYRITVNTTDAVGLRPGSSVILNGVRVGRVNDIAIRPDPTHPVQVVAMIDHQDRIPASATFRIEQGLIGGSAVLALASIGGIGPYLSTDGDAQLTGISQSIMEELAGELDQRLQPMVEAAEAFSRLSETYTRLGGELTELVAIQDPQALAEEIPANLRTTIQRLNTVLDDAQEAASLVRSWLGDEQLQQDVQTAVSEAGQTFKDIRSAVGRYEALADALQADGHALVQRLTPVMDQADAALAEVRRVARTAADGQGTAALLLNNPDLYLSLDDAATQLRAALDELTLLLQKFKSEGVPINF